MAGGNREPGRSVTSKVLAILATFEQDRRTLTLTEIARHADLPASTTHRLVGELTGAGLLHRTSGGHYQLGLRIWEMAQNVGRHLREAAHPFVQDLYSLTGETAHLAVREGNEALYINRVYGTRRVPRSSRLGGRLPLHATAVGKVLVAFGEPWVREAYLRLELAPLTPHTRTHPQRLAEELDRVRERGFATTLEELRPGTCSIAVPVFHTGRVGAGLGLVMSPDKASTMERHLPTLRALSGRIERATAHIPLDSLLNSYRGEPGSP